MFFATIEFPADFSAFLVKHILATFEVNDASNNLWFYVEQGKRMQASFF